MLRHTIFFSACSLDVTKYLPDFDFYFRPPPEPTGVRLRTKEELTTEEGRDWHPFVETSFVHNLDTYTAIRSGLAFWRLGTLISEGKLLPHVKETGEINILYPGSGYNISPLETIHRLILDGKIERANVTYTEINKELLGTLIWYLQKLEDEGFYDRVEVLPSVIFEGSTDEKEISETSIKIIFGGKEINLVFALNRSGEKYYREDQLSVADLIISHDVEIYHPYFKDWRPLQMGRANFLANYLLDRSRLTKERRRKQIYIAENLGEEKQLGNDRHESFMDTSLIEHIQIEGPYGHRTRAKTRGENGLPYYHSAMVIQPEQPLLNSVSPENAAMLIDFFHLAESGLGESLIMVPGVEEKEFMFYGTDPDKILHDGTVINYQSDKKIYDIYVRVLEIAKEVGKNANLEKYSDTLTLLSVKYLLNIGGRVAEQTLKKLETERHDLASFLFLRLVAMNGRPVIRKFFGSAVGDDGIIPAGYGPSEFLYRFDDKRDSFIGPSLDNLTYTDLLAKKREDRLAHIDGYIIRLLDPDFNPNTAGQLIILGNQ